MKTRETADFFNWKEGDMQREKAVKRGKGYTSLCLAREKWTAKGLIRERKKGETQVVRQVKKSLPQRKKRNCKA